jgi:hypothetical protein
MGVMEEDPIGGRSGGDRGDSVRVRVSLAFVTRGRGRGKSSDEKEGGREEGGRRTRWAAKGENG